MKVGRKVGGILVGGKFTFVFLKVNFWKTSISARPLASLNATLLHLEKDRLLVFFGKVLPGNEVFKSGLGVGGIIIDVPTSKMELKKLLFQRSKNGRPFQGIGFWGFQVGKKHAKSFSKD